MQRPYKTIAPKRTQMTKKLPQLIELNKPVSNADSPVNRTLDNKSKLKGGCVHEINEMNDELLDKILHNINL